MIITEKISYFYECIDENCIQVYFDKIACDFSTKLKKLSKKLSIKKQ